ncbi:MAG: Bax inhibitor-1/YccA family protein [Candidatus Omnitrophica bacterium]|nr:Bax inhibitor-1/YccA family protein [Candidatus Omnitrophota bacterium]
MDQYMRASSVPAEVESSFFAGVYRWMATGLFVSALSAFALLASPGLMRVVFGNPILMILLVVGELGLVFWLSARVTTMSLTSAVVGFTAFSALNGVTIAAILVMYTYASVVSTFVITAGTFLIFSVYGYTTKKDLSSLGSICFMGLIGIILASLVNIFLKSPAIYWVTTYIGIGIFIGLIVYDTQRLKAMCHAGAGSQEMTGKLAILGALTLYLDFINLFILLLRLFGKRR